jgi:SAM-dependent methyltransferase
MVPPGAFALRENVRALLARVARQPSYQERLRLLIAKYAATRTFLDVGCMWKVDGDYAFLAADGGATGVCGLDLKPATPKFETRNARRPDKLRFHQGDINRLDTVRAIGTFDLVFCSGVLYHVPNPLLTLARLRSVCRELMVLGTSIIPELNMPQGAIYYPHLSPEARRVLTYRTPPEYQKTGLDTEYRPDWDYSNYFWGLSPSAVEALLQSAGFTVVERYRWRRALCVVCRAVDEPPNFATLTGE